MLAGTCYWLSVRGVGNGTTHRTAPGPQATTRDCTLTPHTYNYTNTYPHPHTLADPHTNANADARMRLQDPGVRLWRCIRFEHWRRESG